VRKLVAILIVTALPSIIAAQGTETEPWPGFSTMTVEQIRVYLEEHRETTTYEQYKAGIERIVELMDAEGTTLEDFLGHPNRLDLAERPDPLAIDRVIATIDIGLVSSWETDPMGTATEAARRYLTTVFNVSLAEGDSAGGNLMVKATIPSMNDTTYWVAHISRDGEKFSGTVHYEPFAKRDGVSAAGMARGPRVSFHEKEILDWSLVGSSGRMFGHFTTRVLLRDGTIHIANAEELLTGHPLPAGW
jgi:uncharacterized protein YegJ (DUF2314 family)